VTRTRSQPRGGGTRWWRPPGGAGTIVDVVFTSSSVRHQRRRRSSGRISPGHPHCWSTATRRRGRVLCGDVLQRQAAADHPRRRVGAARAPSSSSAASSSAPSPAPQAGPRHRQAGRTAARWRVLRSNNSGFFRDHHSRRRPQHAIAAHQSPRPRQVPVHWRSSRPTHTAKVWSWTGRIQSSEHDEFIYPNPRPARFLAHPSRCGPWSCGGGEGATVREILRHPSITTASWWTSR